MFIHVFQLKSICAHFSLKRFDFKSFIMTKKTMSAAKIKEKKIVKT